MFRARRALLLLLRLSLPVPAPAVRVLSVGSSAAGVGSGATRSRSAGSAISAASEVAALLQLPPERRAQVVSAAAAPCPLACTVIFRVWLTRCALLWRAAPREVRCHRRCLVAASGLRDVCCCGGHPCRRHPHRGRRPCG
jgi:hypothetical protein